jgi:mitotic spindle assembly checkpoint protein MAD2
MVTTTDTNKIITLRGSTQIVIEFFGYAINSILYQRGIYPPDSFTAFQNYGLQMMVTTDGGLRKYLGNVLNQLSDWLMKSVVQQLVLVVTSVATGEVLERWVFQIEVEGDANQQGTGAQKPEKEIQGEIQAIIRQITASVTFLPLLQESCTFDLLVYAKKECEVPTTWEESDAKYIQNSSEVRLRSFTTKVHKVDAMVSYKCED